jgi:hypothetical protein
VCFKDLNIVVDVEAFGVSLLLLLDTFFPYLCCISLLVLNLFHFQCTVSAVQFHCVDTWNVFKEFGEGGVGIRLASVYDLENTTSSKTLIT